MTSPTAGSKVASGAERVASLAARLKKAQDRLLSALQGPACRLELSQALQEYSDALIAMHVAVEERTKEKENAGTQGGRPQLPVS